MIEIAEKQYGKQEAMEIQSEMSKMSCQEDRDDYVRNRANDYVKNSAPCNNRFNKSKYNQK